jgi:hypothetical protein
MSVGEMHSIRYLAAVQAPGSADGRSSKDGLTTWAAPEMVSPLIKGAVVSYALNQCYPKLGLSSIDTMSEVK